MWPAEYLIADAYVARISFTGDRADGAWVLNRIWITGRAYGMRREAAQWVHDVDD